MMPQERRRSERFEVFLIVDIKPSSVSRNYFLGLTKSISMEGFSFESQNYDMNPGEILEFEIKDPEGGLHVHAAGKIAWKKVTDFECLIGATFHGLDDESRGNLTSIVAGIKPAYSVKPLREETAVKEVDRGKDVIEATAERKEIIADSISRISDMIPAHKTKDSASDNPDSSAVLEHEMSPAEKVAAILKNVSRKSEPVTEPETGDGREDFNVSSESSSSPSVPVPEGPWQGELEAAKRSRNYIVAALIAVAVISALVLLKPGAGRVGFISTESLHTLKELNETEPAIADPKLTPGLIPELNEPPGAELSGGALKDGIVVAEEEVAVLSEQFPAEPVSSRETVAERPAPAEEQKITVSQSSPVKPLLSKLAVKAPEAKAGETEYSEKITAAAPVQETPPPELKSPGSQPETSPVEELSPEPVHQPASSILFSENTATPVASDVYSASPFSQVSFASYEENFDDNANKWQIFNNDMASAYIKDGEYHIENKIAAESSLIFHYHDFPHNDDFMIETAVRKVKASGRYFYGVIFGGKDAFSHYTFQIINDDSFSIVQHQGGGSKELAVGMANNLSRNLHNTLRITKKGERIIFYINGQYLASVSHLPLFGNKIGFVVGGASEISVDRTHSRIKI